MAEKTKSTQEELPLHEIVLELMFEFNKEKPAELSVTDVFWKISDPSLSELQIKEVLNWLVNEKRVELFGDKYSLDRFEFLEKRNHENPDLNSPANKDIPLHESVLKIMYDASGEKPAELTANTIFWKGSDPAVSERNITEVLNWLVNQRKVDHFAGKYSLDRFEFLEQKNAEDAKEKSQKEAPKPKKTAPPKPPVDPTPKPVKKEPKKASPPKVKEESKAPVKQKETPKVVVAPKAKPATEVAPIQEKTKRLDSFNTALVVLAGVIVIYMVYLVGTVMSNSPVPTNSTELEGEISQIEEKYEKLKVEQPNSIQKFELLERRMELLEEITEKRSDQIATYLQGSQVKPDQSSFLMRLIVSNLLLILILGTAVVRRFMR